MSGPNTSACLVEDGRLVAMAEEERFARQKRAPDMFPARAIKYCVQEAGIGLSDVPIVAVGWGHSKYPDVMDRHMKSIPGRHLDRFADTAESFMHKAFDKDWTAMGVRHAIKSIDQQASPEIRFYSHHESHAASVHYLSGFERSSILCMDGSGEEVATSTWLGRGDDLEPIDVWTLPNSIGWFYAGMTEFLGFKAYADEGKVMGLAPYGEPDDEIAEKLRRVISPTNGSYELDPTFVHYGERSWSRRFTDKLPDLLGPPRLPESTISPYYESVAFESQRLLEELGVHLTRRLIKATGESNLCLSGGVAMNCKMNGVISQMPEVDEIFINPASNDAGTAIGAALLAARDEGISPRGTTLEHPYWGPGFSDAQIEAALKACKLQYECVDDPTVTAAELLDEGMIVGWFQGRMEFGARALGGRSILANPTILDMKDRINREVKFREPFRPFAPSLPVEAMHDYIEDGHESPFMILAYAVQPGIEDVLPSVVHVDRTIRPQTVSAETNETYWRMLNEFGQRSGHPVVLNTSFNIRGEPIICTPNEAIRCFYATGMDALCIGPFLLRK